MIDERYRYIQPDETFIAECPHCGYKEKRKWDWDRRLEVPGRLLNLEIIHECEGTVVDLVYDVKKWKVL